MKLVNDTLRAMNCSWESEWAWQNFLPVVKTLIRDGQFRSVMEIGGGRSPSFTRAEMEELGIKYTSNDISARELSLAPDWVGKAHFDIQTVDRATLAGHEGQYDFIFSKMVMEHVPSYQRAYRNISLLLRPGGMVISFHPTLLAFPFVVNKLMPERLSNRVLRFMFPHRTDTGTPKFPAYYSGCYASRSVRNAILQEGFSDVGQTPFYSHFYYKKVPLVRGIHYSLSRLLSRMKIHQLSAFCYTAAQK
jgi:SAM-dependent methyltransferase